MTSLVFGRLRVKTRKRPGKGDLNHKAFLQSSAGGKKKKSKFKTRSALFYCLSTRHGILFVWFLYSKWFQVEDLKFGAYRISKRSNKWKQNKQKERIPAWKTREQFYRALPALRNTKMTVWQGHNLANSIRPDKKVLYRTQRQRLFGLETAVYVLIFQYVYSFEVCYIHFKQENPIINSKSS